uniref:TolA protein n=1 Tax=Caenorhabditis tropicalis TaxID=1561998 RepID=A0A1I7V374_9PELO
MILHQKKNPMERFITVEVLVKAILQIVITTRRKSFGIRVAQTPQQAQQHVLSQIANLASSRQANEVIVQQTDTQEKTEEERKALEQHQKMIEAQQLAKLQQAAALQAAAARVLQAQNQTSGRSSQTSTTSPGSSFIESTRSSEKSSRGGTEESSRRSSEKISGSGTKKAQEEALKQAQQAHAQALLRAQEAQKKAQEEAMKKTEKSQQHQKKLAEEQKIHSRQKTQEEEQKKGQQPPQKTNASFQAVQNSKTFQTHVDNPLLSGKPLGGELAQVQQVPQEIHAATGPKWSRTPGKVQTQGPQPEQPKPITAVAPPLGQTAMRQTVQIQEKELAAGGHPVMPVVLAQKPQIQAKEIAQKFVEKPGEAVEKKVTPKGQQLEGAKRWVADSEVRENPANLMQNVERGPKAVLLMMPLGESNWRAGAKHVAVCEKQREINLSIAFLD